MMGKLDLLKTLDEWNARPFLNCCVDDPNVQVRNWAPPVDVYEDKEHVVVEAQVPGLEMNDVKISVNDRTLLLEGERKHERTEDQGNYHFREAHYGSFARSFRLPNYVKTNEATATYAKGILTVKVPKQEQAKPKLIPVEVKS